jgi:hypothetical protein
MLLILQKEYDTLHRKGGKPPKLAVKDKLDITLKYSREYRTMDSIAAEYGVCKGTVCLSIQWVEDTPTKDGAFALPGKKVLKRKSASVARVVVDVTEGPVNRPKKGQKAYYSGKKRHTLKTQVIIERNTGKSLTCRKPKAANMISRYLKTRWGKASAIRYRLTPVPDTRG